MLIRLVLLIFMVLPSLSSANSISRGRYLVRVMGCNECHTPGYSVQSGQVPIQTWLTGSPIGFTGPWGTTYPANLRKIASRMDQKTWLHYLKNLKTRPPMAAYDLNILERDDAISIYAFLKSLGDSPVEIPAALPPQSKPQTAYFDFNLKQPK